MNIWDIFEHSVPKNLRVRFGFLVEYGGIRGKKISLMIEEIQSLFQQKLTQGSLKNSKINCLLLKSWNKSLYFSTFMTGFIISTKNL